MAGKNEDVIGVVYEDETVWVPRIQYPGRAGYEQMRCLGSAEGSIKSIRFQDHTYTGRIR